MYCYRFYSLLVETVYMLNTFTHHDSLIDRNDCYVCMYCYRFYSLLVMTVYMLNTFTNCDSLIDKNDCYVCMYDVLLQVLQFVSSDCVHVKYLY
jgi:hypothetical protein